MWERVRYLIVVAIFLAAASPSAIGQCKGRIASFILQGQAERFVRIAQLHAEGKDAISSLLSDVYDTESIDLTLSNPRSSEINSTSTLCGIVSAYFIEVVLAKDQLHLLPGKEFILLGWDPVDYVYTLGDIVDKNKKTVTPAELVLVADAYRDWWQKNRSRSLKELRADWLAGRRPLAGTGFSWR